jgi:hypothetical protein
MCDTSDLLDERLAAISDRLQQLEELVAALSTRMDQFTAQADKDSSQQAKSAQSPTSSELSLDSKQHAAQPAISPGMLEVISLIHGGEGDEAQRRLQALPGAELEEQPAVVAIAAAALFAQRDDYSSALHTLQRARELTDDPRLLKVIQLVEVQVS